MRASELRARKAKRVTWIGLIVNVALTALKLLSGILGRSGAMVADAIHSLSDFATDVVILFGFRFIHKPADKSHRYGHGKIETFSAFLIGAALLFVGVGILWGGVEKIILTIQGKILEKPGWIAFAAALVSIAAKEFLYWFTIKVGKDISSQAVIANAWHHRSDAFSSIGTAIGIGGAIVLGEKWRVLDPVAAVVVSFFIIKVALEITISSIKDLLEASLDDKTEEKIMKIISSVHGVFNPHDLKTRRLGNNVAIDVHIDVKNTMGIMEAHDIATRVEEKLYKEFGEDTVISVHMEPAGSR